MAQELPAIAVAPGSPSMVKQANEPAGGPEQVGTFKNALQSAIGEQSQESAKTIESTSPRRTHTKGSGKTKEAKGDNDAKNQNDADVLQTLANQIACATPVALTAILVRSASPEPSVVGASQESGMGEVSETKSEGAAQSVAGSTVAMSTSAAVSQLVAQTTATLTGDALIALAGLTLPDTKVMGSDQKAATPPPAVVPQQAPQKVVNLPVMPQVVPESANSEKTPIAPVPDRSHDMPAAKTAPPPVKNFIVPDSPPSPAAAKEPAVADQLNAAPRTEDSQKSEAKVQSAPIVDTRIPAQKTIRGADSGRTSFTPQTVEEAIVKQAVESASAQVHRVVSDKDGGTSTASGTGQTVKQPVGVAPVESTPSGESSFTDQEGKKDAAPSSAPAAKNATPPERATPFTVSRTTLHPSGTSVGNLPTVELRTPTTPELPMPLPRELSRAVVDQVIKGLTVTMTDTTQELRVTLKPESLGEIVLKMKMEDGRLQAQIDVAQPAVKAAVESQLTDLRQALQDRGIDVQRIDVVASGQSANVADGQTPRGGKYKQKGGKRQEPLEGIDEIQQARSLGYNTLEVIM